jgi:hypothetical protein
MDQLPGPAEQPETGGPVPARSSVDPDPARHIVFLDPQRDRPISQYSPEGEIQMMGEFASGLSRRKLPLPLVLGLIAILLLPIVVTVVAVVSTWLA